MAIYRVTKDIGFRLEQHVEADTRELAMAIAAKYSNWVNDCGRIEPYYDAFEIDAETAEQIKEVYGRKWRHRYPSRRRRSSGN